MNNFIKGWGSVCLGSVAAAGLGAASFFAIEALMPQPADAHEPQPVVWMLIVYPLKTGSMQKIPMASMEQCEAARVPVGGNQLSNVRLKTMCLEGVL